MSTCGSRDLKMPSGCGASLGFRTTQDQRGPGLRGGSLGGGGVDTNPQQRQIKLGWGVGQQAFAGMGYEAEKKMTILASCCTSRAKKAGRAGRLRRTLCWGLRQPLQGPKYGPNTARSREGPASLLGSASVNCLCLTELQGSEAAAR